MPILELERKGVAKVLGDLSLTMDDLGLKGCTLYYRRRVMDMPVASYRPGADDASKEKTHRVREKLINLAMKKFLFRMSPQSLPVAKIVENDRLVGIEFIRTEIEGSQFDQSLPQNRPFIAWLPFANDSGSVDDNSKLIVWGLGMRVFGTEEYGFRFELKRKSYDIFDSETDDDEFTFGVMWRLGKELARPEEEEVIPLD